MCNLRKTDSPIGNQHQVHSFSPTAKLIRTKFSITPRLFCNLYRKDVRKSNKMMQFLVHSYRKYQIFRDTPRNRQITHSKTKNGNFTTTQSNLTTTTIFRHRIVQNVLHHMQPKFNYLKSSRPYFNKYLV